MRILHIGKYYPPVAGGMERFLGDLVRAQRAAGHDVGVLVHEDKPGEGRDDPAWLMRCPVWLRLFFAPISPAFPFWLARAVRRLRPDVLHVHMPNLSAFWALLLPATRDLPWVIHWQSDVELSRPTLRFAYPHYQVFERALLERAECIIVTSPQYLEASQPLHPWRHKCRVIPLGVDPERLPAIDASEGRDLWKREGLRVLAVGRLTYYKGFETLLRASLEDRGHEIVIVGEGEERPKLERILAQAGNPSWIRLLGRADDATLNRLMASCDVYCLPSRERTEAFGIVLMEAMRYAKPLLVSDLKGSGVTWVARDGENAVIVPPEDVAAWRDALEALAASPARRKALGDAGQARYLRELGIESVARRIDGVYEIAMSAGIEEVETRIARGAPPELDGSPAPERLLIVIPALNEEEDIGHVIRAVRSLGAIDVLVVDDGSTDDTAAIALAAGASVLRAPLWQGAWGAIQTGIRYAVRHGYAGVITMDADGQHEPAYLPQLLASARDADVVIASCPSRGSRMRHIAWAYFRFLTGFELDDLTSGFRYYNARACRLLAMDEATLLDYQDIGVLLLLRHAHLRIAEIPVAMSPRKHGASRVFRSWWTVARYMAETSLLCLARWNKSPRKIASRPAGAE
jgi:glycosyltransferase involved in cell wall biosynthesis